jgi:hypothetical protein
MLVTNNFYSFENKSLQELTNSNSSVYFISQKDSHPNHRAYKEWADNIHAWMNNNKNFGWQIK